MQQAACIHSFRCPAEELMMIFISSLCSCRSSRSLSGDTSSISDAMPARMSSAASSPSYKAMSFLHAASTLTGSTVPAYKMSRLNVQKILYKNVQYLYYIFSYIWSDIYLFSYISWLELPLFINSIKL